MLSLIVSELILLPLDVKFVFVLEEDLTGSDEITFYIASGKASLPSAFKGLL